MDLFSETYSRYFSFDSYEIEGKSTGPKHASIQKAIYDDVGANVEVKVLKADPCHGLVQVTITDKEKNRSVTEIGEALGTSLNNEISAAYPITMAFNRGFDRAALRLLGIYGIYADSEGVMQEYHSSATPENVPVTPKETISKAPEKPVPTDEKEELNSDETIYPYRKYNGEHKSIRYIYENERDTFDWVLRNFKGSTGIMQSKIYNACVKLAKEENYDVEK